MHAPTRFSGSVSQLKYRMVVGEGTCHESRAILIQSSHCLDPVCYRLHCLERCYLQVAIAEKPTGSISYANVQRGELGFARGKGGFFGTRLWRSHSQAPISQMPTLASQFHD